MIVSVNIAIMCNLFTLKGRGLELVCRPHVEVKLYQECTIAQRKLRL